MEEIKCKDCYWYSDVTCHTCDHEHDPCDPESKVCEFYEPKEDDAEVKGHFNKKTK